MMGLAERKAMANGVSSFWLRAAITSTNTRDPVDVLNDVQVLLRIARERVETACLIK